MENKEKILFIFSRFHMDPKNIHHKCGTGLTQQKILKVLQSLGYDVYFGGQEDLRYPKDYAEQSKAIVFIAPALPKFMKYRPEGKLVLFANNSHVLVRNARMRESASKWGLPVESLGPEKYFLPAYEAADYVMFSGNASCTQTFLDNGVPAEKIVHWNNSIDTEAYKPSLNKFPQFTFLHWSSEIGLRKGLPAMLKAWQIWNNKKARLVLMGIVTKKVGRQLLYKRNWLGWPKLNLPGNVELWQGGKMGYPAQDPFVLDSLGKAHVGVFASLEEGQASAALEMAASGLPMIMTEETGYDLDDSWSYKVKADDVDSLVTAFEQAYKDPDLAQKGENARKFCMQHHNIPQFEQGLKDFFVKIIGYEKSYHNNAN